MRKGIRTGKLEIDTLKPGGVQWVSSEIQNLELGDDDKVVSIGFKDRKLHRRIDEVAFELHEAYDPVTGQLITASTAGIGNLIKMAMVSWMLEDFKDAVYDETLDTVVIEDAD